MNVKIFQHAEVNLYVTLPVMHNISDVRTSVFCEEKHNCF